MPSSTISRTIPSSKRGIPLLALAATALLTTPAIAQVGAPNPDPACTRGLCRPIGEAMARCVGNGATPENIKWEDLMKGENITIEDQNTGRKTSMPQRLQCFCTTQGLERRLDNCNGCYYGTNQEDYWFTGINNIKIVCGFREGSGAAEMKAPPTFMWSIAGAVGVSLLGVLVGLA